MPPDQPLPLLHRPFQSVAAAMARGGVRWSWLAHNAPHGACRRCGLLHRRQPHPQLARCAAGRHAQGLPMQSQCSPPPHLPDPFCGCCCRTVRAAGHPWPQRWPGATPTGSIGSPSCAGSTPECVPPGPPPRPAPGPPSVRSPTACAEARWEADGVGQGRMPGRGSRSTCVRVSIKRLFVCYNCDCYLHCSFRNTPSLLGKVHGELGITHA